MPPGPALKSTRACVDCRDWRWRPPGRSKMRDVFHGVRISRRLQLMSAAFTLPIGVMMFLIISTIDKDIQFASLELQGNEYQRPLETLLDGLSRHQLLADRVAGGDATAKG